MKTSIQLFLFLVLMAACQSNETPQAEQAAEAPTAPKIERPHVEPQAQPQELLEKIEEAEISLNDADKASLMVKKWKVKSWESKDIERLSGSDFNEYKTTEEAAIYEFYANNSLSKTVNGVVTEGGWSLATNGKDMKFTLNNTSMRANVKFNSIDEFVLNINMPVQYKDEVSKADVSITLVPVE